MEAKTKTKTKTTEIPDEDRCQHIFKNQSHLNDKGSRCTKRRVKKYSNRPDFVPISYCWVHRGRKAKPTAADADILDTYMSPEQIMDGYAAKGAAQPPMTPREEKALEKYKKEVAVTLQVDLDRLAAEEARERSEQEKFTALTELWCSKQNKK